MEIVNKAIDYIWNSENKYKIGAWWALWLVASIAIMFPIGFVYGFLSSIFMMDGNKTMYVVSYIVFVLVIPIFQALVQSVPLGNYLRNFDSVLNSNESIILEFPFDNFKEKFVKGIKFYVVFFYYSLPLQIITTSIGIFQVVNQVNNINNEVLNLILTVISWGSIVLYSLLMKFFLKPAITHVAAQNGFRKALSIKKIIEEVKLNFPDMMRVGLILFLFSMVFGIGLMISAFSILLCIGVFLFPIMLVVLQIVNIYVEPFLMAQIFIDNNTKENQVELK
ncbi:DUF4013 domain-containing protein [Candidatus Dojkabacteria bacterium]|nr:DUF4013 domain-containing protein [Candidatus Dojkabacteria bacterium]